MSYKDDKLLKKASEMGKFVGLEVGGSFKGIYLGYDEEYSEKYKKDSYHFKFEISGKEKILSSSSQKVIRKMAYIEPGTRVKVTKTDSGNKTNYDIEELAGKKKKTKSLVSKKKKKKSGLSI